MNFEHLIVYAQDLGNGYVRYSVSGDDSSRITGLLHNETKKDRTEMGDALSRLGELGWELLAAFPAPFVPRDKGGAYFEKWILKRPKSQS